MTARVLITGAAGYVGGLLGSRLARDLHVVGTDIRPRADLPFAIRQMDVRDPALAAFLREEAISHVVHLASVLDAGDDRAREFDIDVNGTRNVLDCCLAAGVGHVTVTSSGAAYGYYADNPAWIDETQPLRGNREFAYSDHKRQVEEMLADYRDRHPGLRQLVFRPGTILGATTRNLITNLFRQKRILAIRGSASPFVFIWDEDVVAAIEHGLRGDRSGIYNMAGDGALTVAEIAAILGKPVLALPAGLVKAALWMGRRLGVGRYGPEQVNFLRYRPVLSNRRLKHEFGYRPQKTSEETFRFYVGHARERGEL
jgi:UDP-glucose 4-epimerase